MQRRDEPQPPRHPNRHPSRRPPPRRSRFRKLLKWSGTLACLLILLAAAAGLRWQYIEVSNGKKGGAAISLGSVYVWWNGVHWDQAGLPSFFRRGVPIGPIYEVSQGKAPDWVFWPQFHSVSQSTGGYVSPGWVAMPLWIPFVLIALPTGWLWWRDRGRVPAGCCAACGYDLTGNVSGRCPECGALREVGTPKSEV